MVFSLAISRLYSLYCCGIGISNSLNLSSNLKINKGGLKEQGSSDNEKRLSISLIFDFHNHKQYIILSLSGFSFCSL